MLVRKVIAISTMALVGLFHGFDTGPVGATPETREAASAPVHTNADAYNICAVFDTYWWGPEVNNAYRIRWAAIHYYGLEYAECCYDIAPYGYNAHGIYSLNYGTWEWLPGTAWCPNS
jgi:hypothetical protein